MLIIDTDMGVDDAISILYALKQPRVKLHAITCVFGNVDLKQAVANAKTILALADRYDVSVYVGVSIARGGGWRRYAPRNAHTRAQYQAGADGPLLRTRPDQIQQWQGHGKDGLGNSTKEGASNHHYALVGEKAIPTQGEHAANALVRLVNSHPGEITLACIGPLTNIALACRLDPTFLSKCKKVVIMGGCLFAKGNASKAAEFNFHADPEAAHIVFQESQKESGSQPKLSLVAFETCLEHSFHWDFYDHILNKQSPSKFSQFLKSITGEMEAITRTHDEMLQHTLPFSSSTELGPNDYTPFHSKDHLGHLQYDHLKHSQLLHRFMACDYYALLVAIEDPEEIIAQCKNWVADIELTGVHSRGMMTLEWYKREHNQDERPNVCVVLKLDMKLCERRMWETFAS